MTQLAEKLSTAVGNSDKVSRFLSVRYGVDEVPHTTAAQMKPLLQLHQLLRTMLQQLQKKW
jgi:hypothetical protein